MSARRVYQPGQAAEALRCRPVLTAQLREMAKVQGFALRERDRLTTIAHAHSGEVARFRGRDMTGISADEVGWFLRADTEYVWGER